MKKFLVFFFGISAMVSIFAYAFFMDAYSKLTLGTFETMSTRHPFLSLFFGLLFALCSTMMIHISWLRFTAVINPIYSVTATAGFVIVLANAGFLTKIFNMYKISNGFSSDYVSSGVLPVLLHMFLLVLWSSIITNKKEEPEEENMEVEMV